MMNADDDQLWQPDIRNLTVEKFESRYERYRVSIRQIAKRAGAELRHEGSLDYALSFPNRPITVNGGARANCSAKLHVKPVSYDGVEALAFYFHDIQEVVEPSTEIRAEPATSEVEINRSTEGLLSEPPVVHRKPRQAANWRQGN